MRVLVILLLLWVTGAFFIYPPLIEKTGGECSALDQRNGELGSRDSSGLLIVGRLYGSSSSEPGGAAFAKDHYPLLPAEMGCALAYWKTVFSSPALLTPAAAHPAPPPPPPPPAEPQPPNSWLVPTLARGITLNGDPISPGSIFTTPMNSVAIRIEYQGRELRAVRFQVVQGRTVLASCTPQQSPPGTAWCDFNVSLRKGNYWISLIANNVLLGQFPFTVIGG